MLEVCKVGQPAQPKRSKSTSSSSSSSTAAFLVSWSQLECSCTIMNRNIDRHTKTESRHIASQQVSEAHRWIAKTQIADCGMEILGPIDLHCTRQCLWTSLSSPESSPSVLQHTINHLRNILLFLCLNTHCTSQPPWISFSFSIVSFMAFP